ncbi:hemicentin-1-like [Gigantopelta aegis]|uniref:hemicentin-1-like n=1 Tax=Gigantopelta aegis TaxID=1735272 RepID=UPI001B887CDC|nr:hemicentin-1-like [Gigantopelta aegis]
MKEEKATDFKHEITGLEPQATYYVMVIGEDEVGITASSKQSSVGTMPEENKMAAVESGIEQTGSGNGTMMDYDFDEYEDYEPEFSEKTTEKYTSISPPVLNTTENSSSAMENSNKSLPIPSDENHMEISASDFQNTTALLYSTTTTKSMTASTRINTTVTVLSNATTISFTSNDNRENISTVTTKKSEVLMKTTVNYDLSKSSEKQDHTTAVRSDQDQVTRFTVVQTTTDMKKAKTTRTSHPTDDTRVHIVTNEVFTVTLKPNGRPNHWTPKLKGEETMTVTVNTGEALDLMCRVDGSPVPSITWLRNDIPIVSGESAVVTSYSGIPDSRLVVLKTDENSAGLFKCVAENYLGLAEQKFWVMLKEVPCAVVGSHSVVWTSSVTLLVLCVLSSVLV